MTAACIGATTTYIYRFPDLLSAVNNIMIGLCIIVFLVKIVAPEDFGARQGKNKCHCQGAKESVSKDSLTSG